MTQEGVLHSLWQEQDTTLDTRMLLRRGRSARLGFCHQGLNHMKSSTAAGMGGWH